MGLGFTELRGAPPHRRRQPAGSPGRGHACSCTSTTSTCLDGWPRPARHRRARLGRRGPAGSPATPGSSRSSSAAARSPRPRPGAPAALRRPASGPLGQPRDLRGRGLRTALRLVRRAPSAPVVRRGTDRPGQRGAAVRLPPPPGARRPVPAGATAQRRRAVQPATVRAGVRPAPSRPPPPSGTPSRRSVRAPGGPGRRAPAPRTPDGVRVGRTRRSSSA